MNKASWIIGILVSAAASVLLGIGCYAWGVQLNPDLCCTVPTTSIEQYNSFNELQRATEEYDKQCKVDHFSLFDFVSSSEANIYSFSYEMAVFAAKGQVIRYAPAILITHHDTATFLGAFYFKDQTSLSFSNDAAEASGYRWVSDASSITNLYVSTAIKKIDDFQKPLMLLSPFSTSCTFAFLPRKGTDVYLEQVKKLISDGYLSSMNGGKA